jgi:hypothetical protein
MQEMKWRPVKIVFSGYFFVTRIALLVLFTKGFDFLSTAVPKRAPPIATGATLEQAYR